MSSTSLDSLRQFAVARSLFTAKGLQQALDTFGFVQADPIRAPARAQDLALRHRVPGYRAGDLDRRYSQLRVEEDFLVNYGFVTPEVHGLMHPRGGSRAWAGVRGRRAAAILEFVREHGAVHPRQVDQHFAHGRVRNYWGGSSNATTHLMLQMHYRGLLRVLRREKGVRIYGVPEPAPPTTARPDTRLDALVDVIVRKYAPLPGASLSWLVRRLQYAVPQWKGRLSTTLQRARRRLAHARVDGVDWYWPAEESPAGSAPDDVRLLAPFDPIVWDRRRFELLWDWAYRFEAYTPLAKRKLGDHALPLLWRGRVVGWGNVRVEDEAMKVDVGYVAGGPPRERPFKRALDAELERLREFLALGQ